MGISNFLWWALGYGDDDIAARPCPSPPIDPPPPLPQPGPPLPPPKIEDGRRPRAVLLHGTATNEFILKFQMARFWSWLEANTELHVLEGTRDADERHQQAVLMRRWFGHEQRLLTYASMDVTPDGRTRGYSDETMRGVASELEGRMQKLGRVDILIGFSQGAAIAAMLTAHRERVSRIDMGSGDFGPTALPFHCVVLLCPPSPSMWLAPVLRLKLIDPPPIYTPALILSGTQDDVVGPDAAAAAAEPFVACTSHSFDDGHRPLPAAQQACTETMQYIANFIGEHVGCSTQLMAATGKGAATSGTSSAPMLRAKANDGTDNTVGAREGGQGSVPSMAHQRRGTAQRAVALALNASGNNSAPMLRPMPGVRVLQGAGDHGGDGLGTISTDRTNSEGDAPHEVPSHRQHRRGMAQPAPSSSPLVPTYD